MTARVAARVVYAFLGAIGWSAPGLLVGYVSEAAWPYAFFPLLAYGAWRGATVRVVEEPDALRVRNVVLSFRLPWTSIVDVSWRDPFVVPRPFVVPCVKSTLRRRRVPVLAMPRLDPSREDVAQTRRWAGRPATRQPKPARARRRPRRR